MRQRHAALGCRILTTTLFFGFLHFHAFADDEYSYIDALCDKQQNPRLLNIIDIPDLSDSKNPVAIISPRGDFNQDGVPDIALSGIYDLKKGAAGYFLLVATMNQKKNRPEKLFFKEYEKPVFLFTPGTTGEADPKDQAFSSSFCTQCEIGDDYYWDKSKKSFFTKPWSKRTIVTKKVIVAPAAEVPADIIDKALKIVGALPDVMGYVNKLKKQNKTLGTRVSEINADRNLYHVTIFEKKASKENTYDDFTVDIEKGQIVRRSKH